MAADSFFDFQSRITRRPTRAPAAVAVSPAAGNAANALSVLQLTQQIQSVLKSGMPAAVIVKGELSNYSSRHPSGHHYFTLKDPGACVDCVMWRDDVAQLKFRASDGIEVIATGRIGVYPQRGKYQLYVSALQPLGQGALELAFRQLREKLGGEGLFRPERKRPLPAYPTRVILVTSRATAALQDILKVLRRHPSLKLSLYHVPVQGDAAPREIVAALEHISRESDALAADLIVLGRGGGSLEDLWCFNHEAVARAVAASRIPVITGIGHEVDVSICDLIADYHAHTPTEAAQVVVRLWRNADGLITDLQTRLARGARQIFREARQRVSAVERHEAFRKPFLRVWMYRQLMDDHERSATLAMSGRLRDERRTLQDLASRLEAQHPLMRIARERDELRAREQRLSAGVAARAKEGSRRLQSLAAALAERHPRHRVRLEREHLAALESRLRRTTTDDLHRRRNAIESLARNLLAVGPEQVLSRGYSLTTRKRDGAVIRSVTQITPGEVYVSRFADGQVEWVAGDGQLRLFS